MKARAIEYQDLLEVPYESGRVRLEEAGTLDCFGMTAEVVRRACGEDAFDDFLQLLEDPDRERWTQVNILNPKLGDVALSRCPERGLHVSGVVSLDPPTVLSSSSRHGAYSWRLSMISDLIGLYRYPRG
jgi:hypothetical protein